MRLEVNGSFSSSKQTKHIKCRYFFIRDKIANGDLEVRYCPMEKMWANVLTKPKQGGPFRLDCSHLMNIPINYNNVVECINTYPLLLPKEEQPKLRRMNNLWNKTPIIHPRSVLGNKSPSPMERISDSILPVTANLKYLGKHLSWADRTRSPQRQLTSQSSLSLI